MIPGRMHATPRRGRRCWLALPIVALSLATSAAVAQDCKRDAPDDPAAERRAAQRAARRANFRGAEAVGWPEWFYPSADATTRAVGLAPLDRSRRARGVREVRIWHSSMGIPAWMYRIRAVGGRVSGEVILHWTAPPADSACANDRERKEHAIMLYSQPGRCAGFVRGGGIGACRARFVRPPDWASILRRMEAAGLWNLPDQSTLPPDSVVTLDGWGMTVELLDDARYRAYRYSNPRSTRGPEERGAIAVDSVLRELSPLIARADVDRDYRGIYEGPVGPEARLDLVEGSFRACGSRETWGVKGWMAELPALRDASADGIPRPVPPPEDTAAARQSEREIIARILAGRTAPTARLLVEVRGELSPVWLARDWNALHERVLQLYDAREARPWTAPECPARH